MYLLFSSGRISRWSIATSVPHFLDPELVLLEQDSFDGTLYQDHYKVVAETETQSYQNNWENLLGKIRESFHSYWEDLRWDRKDSLAKSEPQVCPPRRVWYPAIFASLHFIHLPLYMVGCVFFLHFRADIVSIENLQLQPVVSHPISSVSDPKPNPLHIVPSSSTRCDPGNILEAVNCAMSVYDKHYIDRDLNRTGQNIVLLTAGAGRFRVSGELARLTKQRMIDHGEWISRYRSLVLYFSCILHEADT